MQPTPDLQAWIEAHRSSSSSLLHSIVAAIEDFESHLSQICPWHSAQERWWIDMLELKVGVRLVHKIQSLYYEANYAPDLVVVRAWIRGYTIAVLLLAHTAMDDTEIEDFSVRLPAIMDILSDMQKSSIRMMSTFVFK
ncbi:hypothetical protein AURDEDRAFT_157890 [Auricularia subglabra TFB-10046 SS5]|nr:hypothetical protein AURDEDRAFT_157890 [Auricularia subglabra TFB-10046 SS5]